jgi:hypothetical protein
MATALAAVLMFVVQATAKSASSKSAEKTQKA